MSGFISLHGVWDEEHQRKAHELLAEIERDNIELVRFSFPDLHGVLRGKALTAQNARMIAAGDTAGDVTAQGTAPKAWIRRDGTFYLLKDGDKISWMYSCELGNDLT